MSDGLTLVRIPTYRRPQLLARALATLQAQTTPHWRCIVYDDSPDESCKAVCDALGDARVTHVFNDPRRYAAFNIDQCFARTDDADYFFVLEDDNFVLPTFIEDNIAALKAHQVPIVLRNQYEAPMDIAPDQVAGLPTVLADRFLDRVYDADEFACSALFSIGVSNGGLFWSRQANTDFETRAIGCDAVLQEHMRAFLVRDRVYVAMQPLAVWSDNGEQTTRHSGGRLDYFQRETTLKNSLNLLRRALAGRLKRNGRYELVRSDIFLTPLEDRQRELAKALLPWPGPSALSAAARIEQTLRGVALRALGRPPSGLIPFLENLTRDTSRAPGSA